MMTDVAFMPFFWDVELVLSAKGVKGDVTAVETGYNLIKWSKE